MTEIASNAADTDRNAARPRELRDILQWLASPLAPRSLDELPLLRLHLKDLHDVQATPLQRAHALDRLYKRSMTVIACLLPSVTSELVLPVPRKTRRIVNSVLDLLQMLADDTLALQEGVPRPAPPPDLAPVAQPAGARTTADDQSPDCLVRPLPAPGNSCIRSMPRRDVCTCILRSRRGVAQPAGRLPFGSSARLCSAGVNDAARKSCSSRPTLNALPTRWNRSAAQRP
jgi:hypothetical protein